MIGDGTGEPLAKISMVGMEVEERDDCTEEILDVLGLGLLPAFGVGGFTIVSVVFLASWRLVYPGRISWDSGAEVRCGARSAWGAGALLAGRDQEAAGERAFGG
jgi:hypothetical protein